MMHEWHAIKVTKIGWECCWALWKVQNKVIPTYPKKGKWISGRRSNPMSRQQMCQNRHNAVRKANGILGGSEKWGRKASDGM
jgi:hypothetical protein